MCFLFFHHRQEDSVEAAAAAPHPDSIKSTVRSDQGDAAATFASKTWLFLPLCAQPSHSTCRPSLYCTPSCETHKQARNVLVRVPPIAVHAGDFGRNLPFAAFQRSATI